MSPVFSRITPLWTRNWGHLICTAVAFTDAPYGVNYSFCAKWLPFRRILRDIKAEWRAHDGSCQLTVYSCPSQHSTEPDVSLPHSQELSNKSEAPSDFSLTALFLRCEAVMPLRMDTTLMVMVATKPSRMDTTLMVMVATKPKVSFEECHLLGC
jgi:hypothetical protein